jgi:hypothetical protein
MEPVIATDSAIFGHDEELLVVGPSQTPNRTMFPLRQVKDIFKTTGIV